MMIFHGNLRKITEIIENFVAKILKICLKKKYILNRYAGNSRSLDGRESEVGRYSETSEGSAV